MALLAFFPLAALAQSTPSPTRDPEQLLWQEIAALAADPTTSQPYHERLSALPLRWQALHDRVRNYLTLYPGGKHRDEAVQLELSTLFELGSLRGGSFEPLRERVAVYLKAPPDATAHAEAAYWQLLCQRSLATAAGSQPASAPILAADEGLLAAYREYCERYPRSRHAARMSTVLFEEAQRRHDLPQMQQIARRVTEMFPDARSTAEINAELRREENIGRTFWVTGRTAGGETLDTRTFAGRPLLIVVWAGFEPRAVSLVSEIERRRAAAPEIATVGVSVDERLSDLSAAQEALGIRWPQFFDGLGWASEFVRTWGVRQIPFVLVIDRDGRLLGAAADDGWSSLLDEALRRQ